MKFLIIGSILVMPSNSAVSAVLLSFLFGCSWLFVSVVTYATCLFSSLRKVR